jgi:hypothetical protein
MPDSTKPPRRFPPPWTVEDKDAYFVVRDHNGQALAYVYAEDKRTGRATHTRRSATDRGEHRQAAAIAHALIAPPKRRTPNSVLCGFGATDRAA